MAKFSGNIGFVTTRETSPGVHEEVFLERNYRGDIIRDVKSWEKGESLNDNLTINNRFSIVGDEFVLGNLSKMRYVKWQGVNWKISSFEIARPRIILSVGGVFNGT